MEQTENFLVEFDESAKPPSIYGSFWQRFAAFTIDLILLYGILTPLDILNVTICKNYLLLLAIGLTGFLYKPICEYIFGASIGKMILRLFLADKNFNKISLGQALLRNIVYIVLGIFELILMIIIFNKPAFKHIASMKEYNNYLDTIINLKWYNYCYLAILIVEMIYLLLNKKKRALHDILAGTYVIKKKKVN